MIATLVLDATLLKEGNWIRCDAEVLLGIVKGYLLHTDVAVSERRESGRARDPAGPSILNAL